MTSLEKQDKPLRWVTVKGRRVPIVAPKDRRVPTHDQALIDRAVKEFGVTDDPRKCGFILPDGRMLDFGDQGDWSGQHAKIAILYDPEFVEGEEEFLDLALQAVLDFQSHTGAVRFASGGRGQVAAEFRGLPTPEQWSAIDESAKWAREYSVDYRHSESDKVLVSEVLESPSSVQLQLLRRWIEYYEGQGPKPTREFTKLSKQQKPSRWVTVESRRIPIMPRRGGKD